MVDGLKKYFSRCDRAAWLWAVLLLLVLAPGSALSQSCKSSPECKPEFKYYGLNGLVKITDCKTTDTTSSCAWAGVNLQTSNFLACRLKKTGPIALCFYSGVPGAPLNTPACVLSKDKKTAECDCYKISENRPEGATYSYVLINAILNKEVYTNTIAVCGKDGSKCLNGANVATNPTMREAPVCESLRDNTLFPGAYVVSDYTPILIPQKGNTVYQCPTSGTSNIYAMCMTAPCRATDRTDQTTGLPIVSCSCPTYDGPNQVGNPQISEGTNTALVNAADRCSPEPYVWSSAYNPPSMPTKP